MRLTVLLLLVSTVAPGQQLDSLLTALGASPHDTTRLKVLDAIVENQSQDYAALEKYSTEMEALSKSGAASASGKIREFYLHYYGTALNNLAYAEENKANNPRAIKLYEQALTTFRDINDKAGEAMCLTNLGYVSKKTGDLPKAIDYYTRSLAINKEIANQPGTYAAINNVGLTFFTLGDMKRAQASYFEALKIAEELGDKRRQARTLNNIAGVYYAQKEVKLHFEYLEKSLALVIESGEKRGEAAIRANIVPQLLEMKEFGKAKEYAERVIQIGKDLSDKDILSNGLSVMAKVSRDMGNVPEAMEYEKQALPIKRAINNKLNTIYSLNLMGELSVLMNKTSDAVQYFNESIALSKEMGYANGVSIAANNLSELYKKQGNTAKALEMFQLHIKMRDSVANEDNRKAAFKSQYKYEYEIKSTADSIRAQGEKAVLSAQLDQATSQRYALTAAIILGVTLASFIFYRFRVRQEMKELQLRNRIASDLHDEVGSAISSISLFAGMAKMRSGKESEDIVAKIENTSRETVDNMSDIVWSIEPANDRFDNVLKKMNFFGEQLLGSLGIGFKLSWQDGIEKTAFDMSKRKNIYLVFKEALNNAAKYSGAKNITVALTKEGRTYVMEINDDGKGFDKSATTFGNGLRNMKRRADELNGTLIVDSSIKGTQISLMFEV